MTVFGTRPEVIKLAPVIEELRKYPAASVPVACFTAQHRHMIERQSLEAGGAVLVGPHRKRIVAEAERILENQDVYDATGPRDMRALRRKVEFRP